jgi:hypothetical protein
MNRKILAGLIGISASAFSSLALASEPETHDGFFFQVNIGGGYLSTSGGEEPFDMKISGPSIAGGLLFGGTVSPGLVIGGGTANSIALGPKVELGGNEADTDTDVSLNLSTIGPFVTFYPDAHGGLSLHAMVSYGIVSITVDGDETDDNPTGLALTGGAGYDFWVAPEWSIGVFGRFTYAPLKYEDETFTTLAPSLLATFTYH